MSMIRLFAAAKRRNGKTLLSPEAAKEMILANGRRVTEFMETDMTTPSQPLSLSTRFKRAAGAQAFGGPATKHLIDTVVYSTPERRDAADGEITLEQVVETAVAELVSQLRHFRLDEDVLRALQTPASTSGSAQPEPDQPPASPQNAADR